MNGPQIVDAVDAAILALKGEKRRMQWDVSERAFAHRLAVHMEGFFRGWDIDCEYNKAGQLHKALEGIAGCAADKKTDRILPDIIVHQRNSMTRGANLLVIEMKLDEGFDNCDNAKLTLPTKPEGAFWYHVGLFINVGRGAFKKTWYQAGVTVSEQTLT